MTERLQQIEDLYVALLAQHAQAKFERTRRELEPYVNQAKRVCLNSRIKELRRQIKKMDNEFRF